MDRRKKAHHKLDDNDLESIESLSEDLAQSQREFMSVENEKA